MKYKISVETDDLFERQAILQAVENKIKLDEIYSAVFRGVLKYGEDEKEVESFKKVWEKLSEYLKD